MTAYTRLLAVGGVKRADVMVASDEPFAAATPWLLELLDERSSENGTSLNIVRGDGTQIDLALSPLDQDLLDGEIVRFVRSEDAPAPPEVADVTTAVADAYGSRPLPWNDTSRHAAAGIAVGLLAYLASVTVAPLMRADAVWVLGAVAVGTAGVAAALRPLRARFSVLMLTSAALGVAATFATAAGAAVIGPTGHWRLAVVYVVAWAILGIGIGVGLRVRGAVVGATAAGIPCLTVAVCVLLGADAVLTAGVVGVVSIALLGLVPWYVVATSGLAVLDDRVAAESTPTGGGSRPVIRAAYGVSAWTTVALALPIALAGAALTASANPWAAWLGVAIAIVAALRTRVAPGRVESLALWAAAFVIAVSATLAWLDPPSGQLVGFGVLVVLVVVGGRVRPAAHVRARLRRLGNLVEWFAVVALLPLLLGVADVYADLLRTFGS